MRRIGLTLLLLAVGAAAFAVTSASAGNESEYKIELDNAFGIVNGSEVRIAGVKAGTVTDLDINDEKKAVITVKIDDSIGKLYAGTQCSAEPQSLIAEYFVDCQPGDEDAGPLADDTVPVEDTTITVPNDLVLNTLREPYKQRLALLINEFGTALTGNAENLNEAIRRGAPALRQLKQVLDILAQQNTTIRDINSNSDAVIAQLNQRREDVVQFIDRANTAAATSAERREDLGETFHLLPQFLGELQPTMRQLGRVAEQGKPLLTELHQATPQLNRFGDHLPAFENAATLGLTSLGDAAEVGTKALTEGDDEINQLRQSTTNAPKAADLVSDFLESIDDPQNIVEEDGRSRDDLRDIPGEVDRRVDLLNKKTGGGITEPGYTGMEGLLNYAYYQTGALNQFDEWGHILHLNLVQAPVIGNCANYNAGPTYPNGGTDPKTAPHCVSILGDNQPGIGVKEGPTPGLQRYDDSVCPDGSNDLLLCDPTISTHGGTVRRSRGKVGAAVAPSPASQKGSPVTPAQLNQIQEDKPLPPEVQQALGVDSNAPLSDNAQLQQLLQSLGLLSDPNAPATQSADMNKSLLDFLFGS